MIDAQRRSPPPEALAWVADALGPGTTIRSVRRLLGGIGTAVHRVTVETRSGARISVVLRRWVDGPGRDDAGDATQRVLHEQLALQLVEPSSVPAPRVLAVDPDGNSCDAPALLMTRVPGAVFLAPRALNPWLCAMADTLHHIHALEPDDRIPAFTPLDITRTPPDDAARPDLWLAAIDLVGREQFDAPTVFRHGDYQHFNLLWSRERLTGVVDWTFPNRGPAGLDVGHCMLNLAVLISAEAAERFRARYDEVSGSTVDPSWLVAALMRYSTEWQRFIPIQVHGQVAVDTDGMTARVESTIDVAMRRLGL